MTDRRFVAFCFVSVGWIAVSCTDDATRPALDDLQPALSAVSAGEAPAYARGEALFAEIAAEAPGFGGYFFEGGTLVVTYNDADSEPAVRSALESRTALIRPDAEAPQIEGRLTDFSYLELAAWRETLFELFVEEEDVRADIALVDLDERVGHLVVGL
jgi:hypothetical protein